MHTTANHNTSTKQIKLIRKYLKLKILEDNVTFRNNSEQRFHIYDLIKRTVSNGESHSALMIGPKGCGKTTLINSVLHQLSKEVDLERDAIIVKLDGLVHSDEKIALKSITAQMQLENAVGDRVFGTFAENLSFLISCLNSGSDRRCKSMVFLVEQFHMLCGRTQTLLYNLFDITHSERAPVCVVGITNRLDVMELLEKRVKSRFSHRHILVFPPSDAVRNYQELMMKMLGVPAKVGKRSRKSSVSTQDHIDTESEQSLPEVIQQKCKINPLEFKQLNNQYLQDWNYHVQSFIENEQVADALDKFCYYTVNEQIFRNVLFQLVSKISERKPYLDPTDFISIIDNTVAPEHRVKLLQSLSILELSLVIAMKHGMDIFDGQPMNFEMVLHRYTKFANTNSSTQTVPRPVILKAFEHLQALEIILPVKVSDSIYSVSETSTSRVQKEYKMYTLCVNDDVGEAVKNFKALPTEIYHWYHNSVD